MLWAAWAVRLWHLDASDLTFDEAATYFVAYRPLPDILAYLRAAVREHPPVFYLLMRPWMSLAGTSEYSLRFFAAGASLVGVALTARLARRLARQLNITDPVELFVLTSLPALILALFPFEVYHARDARMYTLVIVWAVLSSLQFLPLLFDPRERATQSRLRWLRPGALGQLVLINALAVFTHYYLALLIVAQFVSLLLLLRWRALLAWSTAHGVMGLIGLVWLARAPGLASTLSEAWGRFTPIWPTVGQLRRLLADLLFGPVTGVPWNLVYGWGALVALGLLVAWLRPAYARRRSREAGTTASQSRILGPWLTITLLLPVTLAFLMPEPPQSRHLVFVLPFAALASGQILRLTTGRKRSVLLWFGVSALVISNLGVFGLPRTVRWIKSSYGHTIATVSAHARPGDGVLFYGPWQAIQFYYYRPEDFPPITLLPRQAPPQLVPEEAEPVLGELLDAYQRLWVIPAAVDDVDPIRFVYDWLNTQAHPVWATPDWSLYLPPTEQEALSLPIELDFGDRLRLERLTSDARVIPAGEGFRLTFTWIVSDSLDSGVRLDLSLVDEGGNLWRQWHTGSGHWPSSPSTWEAGDVITDRDGVIVPQGAPPGTYTVQLTAVDAESDTPLQPSDANGPLAQANLALFSFEVIEPVSPPVLMDVGDFVGPFNFESPEEANAALTLAGYELGGLKFQQGNPVPVRLHWLAPVQPTTGLELRLQLQRRSRLGLARSQVTSLVTESLPLAPAYPVTEWSTGRIVSLPTALSIPLDASPGQADLTLAILGPDGQPWMIGDSQHLNLGTLTIEERPMLRQLPAGLTVVQVDFVDAVGSTGDQIGLRGYRVDGDAQPGGYLDLTYAWHALSQPGRIYSVFNHLLTADGQGITQADGWPQGGVVLTSQWRPGEYILDSHTLTIPTDAPPGPYLLAVGLYDVANAERLSAIQDEHLLPYKQWLVPVPVGEEGQE